MVGESKLQEEAHVTDCLPVQVPCKVASLVQPLPTSYHDSYFKDEEMRFRGIQKAK